MLRFNDDITAIKGIGEKTAQSFKKLGITTVRELIRTYPRSYIFYGEPEDIKCAPVGERCAIMGIISSYVYVRRVRNLTLTTITIQDSTGKVNMTWFNQPYLKNAFHKGDTFVFVGNLEKKNGSLTMNSPEYYRPEVYAGMRQKLQPVYPLTAGLSNKTFLKAIRECESLIYSVDDYLPSELRDEFDIMDIGKALYSLHFPLNEDVLRNALLRMAFDEFYSFLYEMGKLKEENITHINEHKIVQGKNVSEFVDSLPYSLTKGQMQAIEDILADMGSDTVMNRLVQGDVGSGKTVVAEAALFACCKEGYQGALMVPTEVLARQHYKEMAERFNEFGIRIACLTGSTSIKEKRHIYEAIREGETDLVIGTHALLEDKVSFKNLGLVVTDEQHRFGVNQRKMLSGKGDYPHTLIMSATPIPRTLAIIMYADLDISIISELPKGRKPIKNCVVGTNYRATAYSFIKQRVAEGEQVYVICPMVEESDVMELTNVTSYTDTLKEALGEDISVCMLHGRMRPDEKNDIMESFVNGDIQVLVSTTVIEVGINNPNATVMMVENAERFGLAQLHQLRGRVGRGKKQSYCIFINGRESKESTERLKVLENSNDGFFIAGEDLKLRGPGDFFGIRQSGEAMFNIADIYNHAAALKKAQEVLEKYGKEIKPFSMDFDSDKSYITI